MTDRHLDDDELLEIALGDEDAVADAHLADCPECHARYRELDEAVRGLVVAAPSVDPPAGFFARVLELPVRADGPGPGCRHWRLRRLWSSDCWRASEERWS